MARQNRPRSMGREDYLAERVAELRHSSLPPMSYETLAKRMAEVGCPIQPSALHRIEKGTPRRKVSVDELVAFSEVFGKSIQDLISKPQGELDEQVQEALATYVAEHMDWQHARDRLTAAQTQEALARQTADRSRRALEGWFARLGAGGAATDVPLSASKEQSAELRRLVGEISVVLAATTAPEPDELDPIDSAGAAR